VAYRDAVKVARHLDDTRPIQNQPPSVLKPATGGQTRPAPPMGQSAIKQAIEEYGNRNKPGIVSLAGHSLKASSDA
jgi:hypothetical protein